MKKSVFYGVIALLLIGCGGGSSSIDSISNSTPSQDPKVSEATDPSQEESVNVKSVEEDIEGAPIEVADSDSNPFPAPAISDELIVEYLKAINDARAAGHDCGKLDEIGLPVRGSDGRYVYDGSNVMAPAPALKWSDKLYRAAYEHSYDLAKSDTASHYGSGTEHDWTGVDMGGESSTFVDRARNNGYEVKRLGENISMGEYTDSAEKAVKSWLASPLHCTNLMNPEFTEVGLGHVSGEGGRYVNYWTQVLGTSIQ